MTTTTAEVVSNEPEPTRSGFHGLGLSRELLHAVAAAGYTVPTPIQQQAIPEVAAGKDVLGCAATGTGKTAAFVLPILQRLMDERSNARTSPIRCLVLAPTRELASQIADSFEHYGVGSQMRHVVIFGGVAQQRQIRALRRGVDIVVATPGRLLDLMQQGEVALDHVNTFVLDEADRMLDMGFIRDVRRIVQALPKQRQTLLFSATLPTEIQQLSRNILRDPVRVAVDPVASVSEPISQSVYFVETSGKIKLLLKLLEEHKVDRALVFTRTKRGANRVSEKLVAAGVAAAAIHGNKSQNARERALLLFKRGDLRAMVATDIAARGIDIKDLSHVINFDLPMEAESYVHRVGRTGRAGKAGVAFSFCSTEDRQQLQAIERLIDERLDRVDSPAEVSTSTSTNTVQPETRRRRPRNHRGARQRRS